MVCSRQICVSKRCIFIWKNSDRINQIVINLCQSFCIFSTKQKFYSSMKSISAIRLHWQRKQQNYKGPAVLLWKFRLLYFWGKALEIWVVKHKSVWKEWTELSWKYHQFKIILTVLLFNENINWTFLKHNPFQSLSWTVTTSKKENHWNPAKQEATKSLITEAANDFPRFPTYCKHYHDYSIHFLGHKKCAVFIPLKHLQHLPPAEACWEEIMSRLLLLITGKFIICLNAGKWEKKADFVNYENLCWETVKLTMC